MPDIIEILKVIFLGIVEGITEWLPVSSTGHMLLVDEFLQLNASEAFKEMFFIVIQLGAILRGGGAVLAQNAPVPGEGQGETVLEEGYAFPLAQSRRGMHPGRSRDAAVR